MPALDPAGANAISSAVGWFEGTLFGTVATAIAVIEVSSVSFLMLTGRIDVRRAAQVVLGCFIIFGASTVANGILGPFPEPFRAPTSLRVRFRHHSCRRPRLTRKRVQRPSIHKPEPRSRNVSRPPYRGIENSP